MQITSKHITVKYRIDEILNLIPDEVWNKEMAKNCPGSNYMESEPIKQSGEVEVFITYDN